MKTEKFTWGEVIDTFVIDLDSDKVEVTKFHPYLYVNGYARGINKDEVQYHVEALHESFYDVYRLVIAWITYKKLGCGNQDALINGICRALEIGRS